MNDAEKEKHEPKEPDPIIFYGDKLSNIVNLNGYDHDRILFLILEAYKQGVKDE